MPVEYAPQVGVREPLLSTEGAAAIAGLTPFTLTSYRSRGKGPVFSYVRGKAVYRRSDVERWLNETDTDGLLDTSAAAALAGCSGKHLSNLRAYGTGPAFVRLKGLRGKRKIFYRPEDVIAWRDAK